MFDQASDFGMHTVEGCLIVSVSMETDDQAARHLQAAALKKVQNTGAKKVLIDVSAVRVVDSQTFSIFRNMARTITMLGAQVAFVGFQAGVASALVDLDVMTDDIHTAVTMKDGMELFESDHAQASPVDNPENAPEASTSAVVDENP